MQAKHYFRMKQRDDRLPETPSSKELANLLEAIEQADAELLRSMDKLSSRLDRLDEKLNKLLTA